MKAYDAVATYTHGQKQNGANGVAELKAGDLSELAGVPPTGKQSGQFRKARASAVQKGWLRERKQGTSLYYALGEVEPPSRQKWRLGEIVNPS
jgi:hypothetical protein